MLAQDLNWGCLLASWGETSRSAEIVTICSYAYFLLKLLDMIETVNDFKAWRTLLTSDLFRCSLSCGRKPTRSRSCIAITTSEWCLWLTVTWNFAPEAVMECFWASSMESFMQSCTLTIWRQRSTSMLGYSGNGSSRKSNSYGLDFKNRRWNWKKFFFYFRCSSWSWSFTTQFHFSSTAAMWSCLTLPC